MLLGGHCHLRGVWQFGQVGLQEGPKFKRIMDLLSCVDMANPFKIGNVACTLANYTVLRLRLVNFTVDQAFQGHTDETRGNSFIVRHGSSRFGSAAG
jgi:hypothetical protein